jgi:hypothetical protein
MAHHAKHSPPPCDFLECRRSDSYAGYQMAYPANASLVTLYAVLAEPAPAPSIRGETNVTKAKETLDNDLEMLAFEELVDAA